MIKPVIDRSCAICEVPDALRYLEAGHARGRVAIAIERCASSLRDNLRKRMAKWQALSKCRRSASMVTLL